MDRSALEDAVRQIAEDIRAGRVSRAYRERTRHGMSWVLPIAEEQTETKTDRAVRWMIEHDQLSRRAFFAACPWACNSASLHHRALHRIVRAGLAERIAGCWVLRDHEQALTWLREKMP